MVVDLLSAVTTTATGAAVSTIGHGARSFQATGVTSAGSGAAQIVIEVTNNTDWPWMTYATIDLTLGTSAVSEGLGHYEEWKWENVRGRVVTITGTGATVSLCTSL
jgi:hypothetical protein